MGEASEAETEAEAMAAEVMEAEVMEAVATVEASLAEDGAAA